MANEYVDVLHTHDYYKGKSMDFAGIWTSGVRYFNDEYITNFIVYTVKNSDDYIEASALLACKKTHMSKKNGETIQRDNNEPQLIVQDGSVVGISPNDYWIFVCGSVQGTTGKSAEVVEEYSNALALAISQNIGKIVYVKNPKGAYIVSGEGQLTEMITGNEIKELQETKVDKVDGKDLSTEDYTTEEKEKLSGIEDNAQKNVIEALKLNGVKVSVTDKTADINVKVNTYTIDKLTTPEGDYFASYVLRENGARTGSVINIPKDKSVNSGSVEEVTRNGYPYSGAMIGDKYIDLILNDSSKTHIYIPAQKLVDVYSGSKYINVNSASKVISLDYDNLNSDLNKSIKIGVAQIDGLQKRLETLESSDSKVVSIGTSGNPLTGVVKLSNSFTIDKTSNTIGLGVNFDSLATADMANQIKQELLGKTSDQLDYTGNSTDGLSLYGIRNALVGKDTHFLVKDNIGKGLKWSEPDNKIILNIKDSSAIQTTEDGEVILVWS